MLCTIDRKPEEVKILYHYVIVRQDLPLGIVCAQIVHAAGESSPGDLPVGTCAVVLAVENEARLLALERLLVENSVQFAAIREPDPPYGGQLMALGLAPIDKSAVYPLLKKLPLLKELK